jgi:hypothetical protein
MAAIQQIRGHRAPKCPSQAGYCDTARYRAPRALEYSSVAISLVWGTKNLVELPNVFFRP